MVWRTGAGMAVVSRMTVTLSRPRQIYLYDGATGAACYSPGTQICVNCPLHPRTCDSSCADTTRLRRVPNAPVCLRDYVIWRLYPYIRPAKAQEIGDDIARQTLARGLSERAFRRAVDIWASRLEFMQQLRGNNGNEK